MHWTAGCRRCFILDVAGAARVSSFVRLVPMQPENQVPQGLREKVDRELESGERVEWLQMPVPRYFTPAATAGFLFGIPWTAFAIFWTAGAAWGTSKATGPGFFNAFPLFGLPFILIGLGMLSGPLWAYRKALKTVYVITNRRRRNLSRM